MAVDGTTVASLMWAAWLLLEPTLPQGGGGGGGGGTIPFTTEI